MAEGTTTIYTDGSKRKEGKSTGASVIIEGSDQAYYWCLPKECSIFTAEAFAIKSALEHIHTKQEGNWTNEIIILSDSKSVLQALSKNKIDAYTNKYILEIKYWYNKIKTEFRKNITFIWIPAHKGIEGNEIADKIAKEATEEKEHGEIEVPISDLKSLFKKETWIMTQNTIKEEARHKGKDYFNKFYREKEKKPWFHDVNRERYFTTLINRIRANHFNLNASLARKRYIESARCECGNETEDLKPCCMAMPSV